MTDSITEVLQEQIRQLELESRRLREIAEQIAALQHVAAEMEAAFIEPQIAAMERELHRMDFDEDAAMTVHCVRAFHEDCPGQYAGVWDCECKCHPDETVGADVD